MAQYERMKEALAAMRRAAADKDDEISGLKERCVLTGGMRHTDPFPKRSLGPNDVAVCWAVPGCLSWMSSTWIDLLARSSLCANASPAPWL